MALIVELVKFTRPAELMFTAPAVAPATSVTTPPVVSIVPPNTMSPEVVVVALNMPEVTAATPESLVCAAVV